ncbi:head-tail connector protein [Achromobacter spanius]|uniref:head-tail connector protein n=1 Tax=Achromobacter spanius TaxID=217203 RepID=UPI002226D1CB|nr:head-tail connector protein [Achromobacter spanius]MCW3151945.1 head-tail connector protein [Achromobacter spanius]
MAEDWLTLEQARHHLRADPDAEGDADIEMNLEAAKAIVSDYLRRPVPWAGADGVPVPVPNSVVAAAKLILGELHESREAGANPLSPGVRMLLWPHRNVRVM